MINPKFILRKDNGNIETSIKFYFYFNKKRFMYSLGNDFKIYPELWDHERMGPIDKKKCKSDKKKEVGRLLDKWSKTNPQIHIDLERISKRQERLVAKTNGYFSNQEHLNKEIDFNELKMYLNKTFKPNQNVEVAKKQFDLASFIANFVQEVKNGDRTYTTQSGELKKYSIGSAKEYRLWETQWKNFQKSYGRKIHFEDVTLDLYSEYVDFFIKKNYTTNSIGKQIKNLKTIMNASYEERLHNNLEFKRKKFKTLKSEVDNIALSKEDLNKLYKLKLTKKPNYKLARDVFLIGCYTALRYSDFSRIKPIHIKGNYIEMITRKTNKPVRIPMRKEVKKILARYKNNLPKTYEQKVNSYIKEVAKLAGLTDPIEIRENKGGNSKVKTINKNELIKTHTARRTGATLMYLSGVPVLEIMSITGHTSIKNLLKYIKIEQKQISEKLADNPFFK